MCGRFGFDIPRARVAEHFGLAEAPELAPRYNIAPSQAVAAVLAHPDDGRRVLRFLKWGLVPGWARDPKLGNRMINARSETVAEKPAFKRAFAARRAIIPASHFFEWQRTDDDSRIPHCIRMKDGEPMGLAGLWEHWRGPLKPGEDPADLFTCTILTTGANALMAPLHDRMPVVLAPGDYDAWLAAPANEAAALLAPFPDGAMEAWPASPAVNSPANDNPELVRPHPETPRGY